MRTPSDFMDIFERFLGGSPPWPSPMRVEEFVEGQTLVIRAEIPDVDPDKDVDVSISDGALHIRAERHEKEEHKDKDRYRSEFRYGSFSRSVPLPDGVKEEDIKATYSDGVLEVRSPLPETPPPTGQRRIPITRGNTG